MRVLLDSDVLVAGLQPSHPHHAAALRWLDAALTGAVDAVVAVQSIFQAYRVLTTLPVHPRLDGDQAFRLLDESVVQRCRIRSAGCRRHVRTLRALAHRSITGGAVYDGLIAEVGRAAKVDRIVTFNVKDFRRVAPDLAVGAP